MTRGLAAALLASLPTPIVAQPAAPPPTAPSPADADEAIVVTGDRGARLPGAVEHLRRFCFDPLRRGHGFARPTEDADWAIADPAEASALAQGHAGSGFAYAPVHAGDILLWQGEVTPGRGEPNERRCRMLVSGGEGVARLMGGLTGLMGGPPTQRHVGRATPWPPLPGWRQWLWTATPMRGGDRWESTNAGRREAGPVTSSSWIHATTPRWTM